MTINLKSRAGIALVIFLCVSLMIGLLPDYSISNDEPVSRMNGLVSYKYICEIFGFSTNIDLDTVDNLNQWRDRDYGVFIELILTYVEDIISPQSLAQSYVTRHYVTLVIFIIGLLAYVFNVLIIDKSTCVIFASLLVYLLSPRIIADSYYNSKDIGFMSLISVATFSIFRVNQTNTYKSIIFASIAISAGIATRILGIYVAPLLIFTIYSKNNGRAKLFKLFVALCTLTLSVYIFWPFLWENPLENFLTAFKNMSHFRWNENIRLNGNFINAGNLPWYYIPEWISITTPLISITLFAAGLFSITKKIATKNYSFIDLSLLYLFFAPLASVVILSSTLYDGWRQMYFLHVPFSLIATSGFIYLQRRFNASVLRILVFLCYMPILYVFYATHPFQNLYFNELAGKKLESKFDLDYWGLTNLNTLKFILADSEKSSISVYSYSQFSSLDISLPLLNQSEIKRLKLLPGDPEYFNDSPNGPDYIFSHHRGVVDTAPRKYACYTLIRNFKVLDNSISYLYKKNGKCYK